MRLERAPAVASLLAVTFLAGCAGPFGLTRSKPASPAPVDPTVANARALTGHLELVRQLVEGTPVEQAKIVASVKQRYDLAPTEPRDELDYALVLAAPGQAGSDPAHARVLLTSVLASGSALEPSERALAVIVLHDVDQQLDLAAANERLRTKYEVDGRLRSAQADRRLKAEIEENQRLRRDLARARAKLKAITNIERSLIQRRNGTTGKAP